MYDGEVGRCYNATWGRAFTAYYGFGMRIIDAMGLRETRRKLLKGASGRVLDIGTGTGSNLPLYPSAVDELVLAEPDPHMLGVLRRRLGEEGRNAELVQAPAERLPFDDSSFECVSCTMVLCTTPNPAAALDEIARVLRPGGRLLFLEHVRAENHRLARWQDRFEKPWRFLADGCYCNRDSIALIESSPLALSTYWRGQMPWSPLIIRPLVWGSATLPA